MTSRAQKVVVLSSVVVVSVVIVACVVLYGIVSALEPLAPTETTELVEDKFVHEFPVIYLFLAQVDGYEGKHFRVLHGLGGRWGKLTVGRRDGVAVSRSELSRLFRSSFESNGWVSRNDGNTVADIKRLFDIDAKKLSDKDLEYSHVALPDEKPHVFHNCRVHIVEDGSEFVAYCEMGW